jgi:hypothetical protein
MKFLYIAPGHSGTTLHPLHVGDLAGCTDISPLTLLLRDPNTGHFERD